MRIISGEVLKLPPHLNVRWKSWVYRAFTDAKHQCNVTGHCWLMTATVHEHSVIEVRVKVKQNCSIVPICTWNVLDHFFKRDKNNYTQKLSYCLCHWKQSILIIGNTIIVIIIIINFTLFEKLKSLVITLHHKFH